MKHSTTNRSTSNGIPSKTREIGESWLREAITTSDLERRAKRLFSSWPSVHRIAVEYSAFVSPWFPQGEQKLLTSSIERMVSEHERILAKGELDAGADPIVFGRVMFAMFSKTSELLNHRVMSTSRRAIVWEPGSEPIASYWTRNGECTLKFLPEPFDYEVTAPLVRMALYARLLAFHELEYLQRAYAQDPRLDNQETILKELS